MKKLVVVFIALALSVGAQAQSIFSSQSRIRELTEENARLQFQVDSLIALLDSLEMDRIEEEEVFLNGNGGFDAVDGLVDSTIVEYTAEITDSLLSALYENRRITDYIEDVEYDMDSVAFTSSLSDEEIMKRITAMNSYISVPFNPTVKNYIVLYSEKMKKQMGRILAQSSYYMPIFEEAFARYDMPLELKYMAVIESMLNPTATSRAGAKGMWQFMYTTAKLYGLKIDSFVDERLDVEKAVDAAARYLLDAYRVFGDWNLAISSYNCGTGNVNKAIRRAGKRDFWSIYPYLPRETRGYVPAFVGAMYAMTYYKECGIVPDGSTPVPVAVDTFEINRNLHFKQVNELVGVPMDDLKTLNPQYLHDIVPGNSGPCILRIPYNWTNAFIDVPLDSLYAYRADTLISPQIIRNIQVSGGETRTAYRVKNGDYLGRIATRYHVTVNQIKRWNNLRSNNIRVGQILYIYHNGAGPVASAAAASSSSSSTAAKSSSASNSSSTSTASRTSAVSPDSTGKYAGYSTYTVKSGDSFYSIAKNYPGISAQNIMDYNGIPSSKLRPGMKIKIPIPK